jgi:hypothetical protein
MKEINEDNEKKKENKEKKDEISFLINEDKSKLIINKNDKKIDSFEIISKDKEFEDDYGFSDLSFKDVYKNDPLLKHLISHISEYLENSNNANAKIIETLTNFIHYDEFSEEIINNILLNGIPENLSCLRPLIWKSLIGFYPLKELAKWEKVTIKKKADYEQILKKYNYYPNNIKEEWQITILGQIDKDLPRTRFDCPFFSQPNQNNKKETNYDVLRRILFFHANEYKDVSYVQGMNEIIALIFYIFSKDDNPFIKEYVESDAYYTFELLIAQIKGIFLLDNVDYSKLFVSAQINQIKKILKNDEPQLYNYFRQVNIEIDNIVMRWILVLFAQEFTIGLAVNFWDRLFTQKDKLKFICYISAAIIKNNKNNIMTMDLGDIMEWAQQLQNKMSEVDINNIVKIALNIQNKYDRKESNRITIK